MNQVYSFSIDEIFFDYDEIIKEKRRETAYWVSWLISADYGENLPKSLDVLTGEKSPHAPQEKRKMTPERLARIKAAEERHARYLEKRK